LPQSKLQEVVFTALMVVVMVYAMICYNMALATGGLSTEILVGALRELAVMGPVAFVLDLAIVSRLAGRGAASIVDPERSPRFHMVLAISSVSVMLMCPMMSLVATLLFANPGDQLLAKWLQATALNFPMAFCWQVFYAGPLVRFLFGRGMLLVRGRASEKCALEA
jgi:hypothetical protein